MTEDEAKVKWCPFVRVASLHHSKNPREWIGVAGANRAVTSNVVDKKGVGEDGLPVSARCIGSACMAWRQRHQWFDNAQQEPAWVSYAPYAFEPGLGQEREDGFCGLAGDPP